MIVSLSSESSLPDECLSALLSFLSRAALLLLFFELFVPTLSLESSSVGTSLDLGFFDDFSFFDALDDFSRDDIGASLRFGGVALMVERVTHSW